MRQILSAKIVTEAGVCSVLYIFSLSFSSSESLSSAATLLILMDLSSPLAYAALQQLAEQAVALRGPSETPARQLLSPSSSLITPKAQSQSREVSWAASVNATTPPPSSQAGSKSSIRVQ